MKIAVVGCGLIGASLLKGLRASRPEHRLLALDHDGATRDRLRAAGFEVLEGEPPLDVDLLVLAQPLPALLAAIATLGARLAGGRGPIVTDVGGVKAPVLAAAARHLGATPFVGGHPMAGKERGGYEVAEAELFRGRTIALCPAPGADERAIETVASMWRELGGAPVRCSAEGHDAAVARVSHLPYLVAASLARVAGRGDALSTSLAAGGLRDTTRVAEDPTIRHAARLNAFLPALAREAAADLLALATALESGEPVDGLLDEAADARRRIFATRRSS